MISAIKTRNRTISCSLQHQYILETCKIYHYTRSVSRERAENKFLNVGSPFHYDSGL